MRDIGLFPRLARRIGMTLIVCVVLAAAPAQARSFWHPFSDAPTQQSTDIAASELPAEARRVLASLRNGGPFAFPKDGIVFGNREKLLPYRPRGFYTEYTVKTPGVRNRGARRIIAGGDPQTSGIYYYTEDHYQSFKRIRE